MGGDNSEEFVGEFEVPREPTDRELLEQLLENQQDMFRFVHRRKRKCKKMMKFAIPLFIIVAFCFFSASRDKPQPPSKSIDQLLEDFYNNKHPQFNSNSAILQLVGIEKGSNQLIGAFAGRTLAWQQLAVTTVTGNVVDVDSDGNVWTKSGTHVQKFSNSLPISYGKGVAAISTYDGKNVVFACTTQENCVDFTMNDGTNWKAVKEDGIVQLSVGSDGTTWGLKADGSVWKFRDDGTAEQIFGKTLTQISVQNEERIIGVDNEGRIVLRGEDEWRYFFYLGDAQAALFSESGDAFALKIDGTVYTLVHGSHWTRISDKKFRSIALMSSNASRFFKTYEPITNDVAQDMDVDVSPDGNQEIVDEDIPTSPPAPPPSNVGKKNDEVTTDDNPVLIYSTKDRSNFYSVFKQIDGLSELLVTFPPSFRGMSMTDDLISMNVGKKVFFQSWKNDKIPLASRKVYDDVVSAFLTKGQSWFLERGVLTVGTSGKCFLDGTCEHYDEKQNQPKFHSNRFVEMDVSHDGKVVWGLTKDDSIFEWKNGEWQRRSGKLSQVSVGDENRIWGVNRHGHVYEYIGRDNWRHVAWNLRNGMPSNIRVSREGVVMMLTKEGSIFKYNRSSNKWEQMTAFSGVKHLYLL